MSRKIFISYRREDSKYQARILHAALCGVLPPEHVFMDIDSIPPGINFRRILKEWVDQCDMLLALIGPGWLGATDAKAGRRRLDNSGDFVRIEIGEALARDIPVVPVLLDGTPMPTTDELPDDLKELAFRQALFLEYRTFDTDVERLIRKLDLAAAGQAPATLHPDQRAAELRAESANRATPKDTPAESPPAGEGANQLDAVPEATQYSITEWNNRGASLHKQRRFSEAIACFEKALDLDPENAMALFNRGVAKAASGDRVGAIADFSRAIAVEPDDASTYRLRSQSFAALERFAEAAADLDHVIAHHPDSAQLLNDRAWYRMKTGDLIGALSDAEHSLMLDHRSAAALDTRAHILEAMGEIERARADFEQALALDPSIDESRQGLERLVRHR